MIRLLYVSSVSACFEHENDDIYFTKEFTAEIDGKEVYRGNTNVFSVFDLKPDTEYRMTVKPVGEIVEFRTKSETAALNARDFGAVGDGVTEDTEAIQTAINCTFEGGRVVIPEGTYLIAPIILKSGVTIELKKGATLLGHTEVGKYRILPGEIKDETGHEVQISTWEGDPAVSHQPLIAAYGCRDIAIVGEGVIDGNAQNSVWWLNHKARKEGRPRLVFLNACRNVTIHGITGQNAASWQFHPYFSEDVNFYNMSVFAPKVSPNTDGCDPESCDRVNIIGCRFSVGDDCIAIKSGKLYMGRKYKRPANRHTIRNCLMEYGHGAVVLGSEMSGGVTNLTVNRCLFRQADRGLRIKTRRGRGKDAVIDGVTFEKIKMVDVLTPLVMNMYYFCDPDGKTEYVWSRKRLPVDDGTPYLGKFTFRDMECEGVNVACGYFDGLPEMPIKEVELENVSFKIAENAEAGLPAMMSFIAPCRKSGLYFDNVETVKLKNVTFEGVENEEIVTGNVKNYERE